jgi:hypothetical protein
MISMRHRNPSYQRLSLMSPPTGRLRAEALTLLDLDGAAEQTAEKVAFRYPAPKGATGFGGLTASLKRCPDRKPRFSAFCEAALSKLRQVQISGST